MLHVFQKICPQNLHPCLLFLKFALLNLKSLVKFIFLVHRYTGSYIYTILTLLCFYSNNKVFHNIFFTNSFIHDFKTSNFPLGCCCQETWWMVGCHVTRVRMGFHASHSVYRTFGAVLACHCVSTAVSWWSCSLM